MVVMLAVAGAAMAEETKDAKAKVDPSGTWQWQRSFGDNEMDYTLRLQLHEDGKVTGTYALVRNGNQSEPTKIDDGKLQDGKVTFHVTRSWNDREFTLAYEGTVSEKQIEGNASMDLGGNSREFEWQAKRVVLPADVVGTWQLRFETPNGNVMEPTVKIAQDDKQLKGTFVGRSAERELNEVAIKDDQLSFHVVFERDGNEMKIAFQGQPRGESMVGSIESNFGGEPRKFDVEAKRLPDPAKAK
jgi:hypothetical protein